MKQANDYDDDIEEIEGGPTPDIPTGTSNNAKDKTDTAALTVGGIPLADEAQLPYVGSLFSAMVLLIALTSDGGVNVSSNGYYEYGLALTIVTMTFSFLGYIACMMGRDSDNLASTIALNNYFLFVWGFIGACIMTFDGPFQNTGNGFFASWGVGLFGVMGLGVSRETIRIFRGANTSDLGLLAAAIIVVIAISVEGFGGGNEDKNEKVYAIVVALVTVAMVLGFMPTQMDSDQPVGVKFYVLAIFAILWFVLACLTTFRGPFKVTGNGYFASWGGALAAVSAAFAART